MAYGESGGGHAWGKVGINGESGGSGAAKNLVEFQAAMQRMQLPMWNVIYADRDGHIFELFNGHVPVRPNYDMQFWSEPVAGDTSALVWNQIHSYRDLPKVVDPPSGWVQSSNGPPSKDGRFAAVGFDNFIAAVEFATPIRAKVLLTSGNSSDPNSPHYGDHLVLSAQKQLRDAWLMRADIEKHLESRTMFDRDGRVISQDVSN
jgi:acyl-homoserine lactone acylase PvdQ